MNQDICESCGLPASPHKVTDCVLELVHKKRIADEMFNAAIKLIHNLEDPVMMKDRKLSRLIVDLDLATWRYAV
jgi:hypothetical protein